MISFPCLKCTEAVILGITGYTHPFPVCLVPIPLLDILLSPQMQLLLLLSGYLPMHFQMLKHNQVCMALLRIVYDCPCDLPAQFYVQAFCISPSSP